MARCTACNRLMLGGYHEGAERYCSLFCLTASDLDTFCQSCIETTEAKSPGGTFTFNSFGTRLYFSRHRCPTCHSVVQLKAFCALYVPLVPLGRFRVIYVDSARYVGRRLKPGQQALSPTSPSGSSAPPPSSSGAIQPR